MSSPSPSSHPPGDDHCSNQLANNPAPSPWSSFANAMVAPSYLPDQSLQFRFGPWALDDHSASCMEMMMMIQRRCHQNRSDPMHLAQVFRRQSCRCLVFPDSFRPMVTCFEEAYSGRPCLPLQRLRLTGLQRRRLNIFPNLLRLARRPDTMPSRLVSFERRVNH